MKCRRAKGGFTLIELIVVMTIIAVITASVIPVFQGSLSTTEANRAVRDLVSLMKYAQSRAVTDAVEYRVYLDERKNGYWMMRLEKEEFGDKYFERLGDQDGEFFPLPAALEFDRLDATRDRTYDAHYIAFYPAGGSDIAEVKIRERDEPTQDYTIRTTGALGNIEFTEPTS